MKRIWENIKWLFNHPPISICIDKDPYANTCDYCGSYSNTWTNAEGTICQKCQKKVYDKVLTMLEN